MRVTFSILYILLGFHVGIAGLTGARPVEADKPGTRARTEEVLWKSHVDSPIETAFNFIRAEGQLLGLTPEQRTFAARKAEVVPGGTHVRMTQTCQGIPVLDSETVVSINSRNEVVMVSGSDAPAAVLSIQSLR